jgi:hypothetical protein
MIVEIVGGTLNYISTATDWTAQVTASDTAISITFASNLGTMEMSSGINYDNLAAFIGQVKSDCIARGINWSGN